MDGRQAIERAERTVEASEVLRANSRSIAAACADAGPRDVVVAVVGRDQGLRGVWALAGVGLPGRVEEIEDGGWLVTFSPGEGAEAIEARCMQMGRLAAMRLDALRRRTRRRALGSESSGARDGLP